MTSIRGLLEALECNKLICGSYITQIVKQVVMKILYMF